jgi:hypothetical protein
VTREYCRENPEVVGHIMIDVTVPKYFNFATFSKDLLPFFML